MSKVRFAICFVLFLAAMTVSGCTGSTETTTRDDEALDTGSDGDQGDQEPDGNGAETDGDYRPDAPDDKEAISPLLSDPTLLPFVFGETMESRNLNFGETVNGEFAPDRPYQAFTFDALAGARVTLTLAVTGDDRPLLFLYGPRAKNGLWGGATAAALAETGQPWAVLFDYPVPQSGLYLVLAATADLNGDDAFTLSLGCRNQCREPACDDLTCQSFCEGGTRTDADGCPTCVCSTDPNGCVCETDDECPIGFTCADCRCLERSDGDGDGPIGEDCGCEGYYDPVCGEDGATYPNACLAVCWGATVVYGGECQGATEGQCAYDADCPPDQVCQNAVCVMAPICGCPDYFEPVCGSDGRTYSNACELDCVGMPPAHGGPCDSAPPTCQPICGDANDEGPAWTDPCTAERLADEPCAGCEAVCQAANTREEGWYSSCTGLLLSYADCAFGCDCPDIWEPVCGADGQIYANRCEAECRQVSIAYLGECGGETPGCRTNADCALGQQCTLEPGCDPAEGCFGVCADSPSLTECESDADCPEGMVCVADPTSQQTAAGQCQPVDEVTCRPTGCNRELCEAASTPSECVWRPEYACFDFAACRLQANGSCGWSPAEPEFSQCLAAATGGQSCTVQADCPRGYFCQGGACQTADCACPEAEVAVCGLDAVTYPNPCILTCEGMGLAHPGPCGK